MKKSLTELVFILDKSGSMSGLEKDTIGGYNSVLAKQKEADGECRITTVLFDDKYELLHDRLDLRAVNPITENEYYVGGSTALLDAIGKTIHKIKNVQKSTAENYRAQKVMFIIITDGEENASSEYTSEKIKSYIEKQKEIGWEFIFLAANIDAVETARNFGISADRAQNYNADVKGSKIVYDSIAKLTVEYCEAAVGEKLSDNWNEEIQADYEKRSGKNKSVSSK